MKYDIWIGDDASASREIAGSTTVTNGGVNPAYPVFTITRSGGTSATLYTLHNETTGARIMFNWGLRDGESLVLDCRPDRQTLVSYIGSRVFNWGEKNAIGGPMTLTPRPTAMLPGSDLGKFFLQPGANQITCFTDLAGGPTITATLEWKETYRGAD